jgi:hypothetical protein
MVSEGIREMAVDYYSSHKHPQFDINENKIMARQAMINFYSELTGKTSITGQYWTLCSDQSRLPGSEIEQLVRNKFIKKSQFYGVDISPEKIKKNKKLHRRAHWFAGEWVSVLQDHQSIYNPEVVYLDSCSVLEGSPIINLICATLEYTTSGMIFVNTMSNNPHSGRMFSVDRLITALKENVSYPCRQHWELQVRYDKYSSSSKTKMTTIVFTNLP